MGNCFYKKKSNLNETWSCLNAFDGDSIRRSKYWLIYDVNYICSYTVIQILDLHLPFKLWKLFVQIKRELLEHESNDSIFNEFYISVNLIWKRYNLFIMWVLDFKTHLLCNFAARICTAWTNHTTSWSGHSGRRSCRR